MTRWGILAPGLLLFGCGSLFSRVPGADGGSDADAGPAASDSGAGADASTADAGRSDAGGTMDAGPDAGTLDAGMDAGAADSGMGTFDAGAIDGGPFTWGGNLALQADRDYVGVSGTGANNVYIATGAGDIDHWNGQILSTIYSNTTGQLFYGIWASPDGAVFAVGQSTIASCFANCDQTASWSNALLPATPYLYGVCGLNSGDVYAVGEGSGTSGVVLHGPGNWTDVSPDAGQQVLYNCWEAPNGELFASGTEFVLHLQGSTATQESADLSSVGGADVLRWFGIAGVGGWVHVAGDAKTTMSRQPDGGWVLGLAPPGTGLGSFRAVAGVAPEEVFAAGDYTNPTNRARFDGTAWSFIEPAGLANGDTINVNGLWPADANTYFLVGQAINGLGGIDGAVFLIGTR